MKYLIVEQGEYSDYGVSLVEVPDKCQLSEEEILFLLKLDQWDKPTIAGHIEGKITLSDNGGIDIKSIQQEAESHLNRLFCCFPGRKTETILDREYSKDELLKIATENDSSGLGYWTSEISNKYEQYKKGYQMYLKLISPSPKGEL